MPSFLSRLIGRREPLAAPAQKDSRTAGLIAHLALGFARWTPRNSVELTRQGYERNAVAFRCVRTIAESSAAIPWRAYEGSLENPDHPALALLARPNPMEVGTSFRERAFTDLLLFGNAYLEVVSIDGEPRELYVLRPDRMAVVPGPHGWPAAYEYRLNGETVRFDMSEQPIPPILHLKIANPLDDHYGFAPLHAAQTALDIHNAAGAWNKALLDNSARPSGALVYAGPQGATLSQEQFDRLKGELDENFSSPHNAGRPMLLEGGLDWKALSLSPKDMDFIEARAAAAREIALAFGVPPMLLGLPGDNTRANFEEANRAFYRQTIIPLVARTQQSLAAWLSPAFGAFRFDYDIDRLDALAAERQMEWARIGAASFLTDDEKREAAGYGPLGLKEA